MKGYYGNNNQAAHFQKQLTYDTLTISGGLQVEITQTYLLTNRLTEARKGP